MSEFDYKKMNTYYEAGSAARQLEEVPAYSEEADREAYERSLERREYHQERQRIANRNYQRVLGMSPGYVAFLAIALIVTCITMVFYIKLRSEANVHRKTVAMLQTEINELKATNDEAEKRLNSYTEMGDIKKKALNLGMAYPTENQVIYYSIDNSDYMMQIATVPN